VLTGDEHTGSEERLERLSDEVRSSDAQQPEPKSETPARQPSGSDERTVSEGADAGQNVPESGGPWLAAGAAGDRPSVGQSPCGCDDRPMEVHSGQPADIPQQRDDGAEVQGAEQTHDARPAGASVQAEQPMQPADAPRLAGPPQTGSTDQSAPAAETEDVSRSDEKLQTNDGSQSVETPPTADSAAEAPRPRRRILIGSQRDPAAYRRLSRDWIPVVKPDHAAPEEGDETKPGEQTAAPTAGKGRAGRRKQRAGKRPRKRSESKQGATAREKQQPAGPATAVPGGQDAVPEAQSQAASAAPDVPADSPADVPGPGAAQAPSEMEASAVVSEPTAAQQPAASDDVSPAQGQTPAKEPADPVAEAAEQLKEDVSEYLAQAGAVGGGPRVPLPNLREQLPAELASEYEQALGDAPLEELMESQTAAAAPLLPETRHHGRIVSVGREDVFVDLGRREQGRLKLSQFQQPPQPGTPIEVVVERFNEEDGLYELSIPDVAVEVDDWGDLAEGMLVEARVTGHNSGGLECEVNRIRAFIPVSQIALYRVEGLEQFVGQRFTCLVTEANRARRNLVLSRRAVLEREQQEARQRLLDSLEPGQVREGVVRRITDFGAFVDLGGVDGLIHVSRLAWYRVEDPREVLEEGQRVKVKVEKVDRAAGRIALSYRDMVENPWHRAAEKYRPNSVVKGRVTKLMDFGAFVQLEPGVEGLVHISELASRHVWRTSDVVSEGQEVEVLVLSVDAEAQRISLSMKALEPPPPAQDAEEQPEQAPAEPPRKPRRRKRARLR